jgi:transposase
MTKPTTKLIQHLGIIAGICKETHVAEYIDELIPKEKREVSVGQAVVAMILNALGLSGRALYLTQRFFVSRPVETLIGEGITASKLNDASLGTALDAIFEYGITELFFHVASGVLKDQGIETRFAHLDSTTFSLHGEYNSEDEEVPEGVIHITKGYSKDNAPELNQVVAQMISANKSSIPLWIEALSGNSSDKKSFRKTVKQFQKQFDSETMPYMVMDSAFYTKENINECADIRWVTRVAETVKEVKQIYQSIGVHDFTQSNEEGYSYVPLQSFYGGIAQRWLIVHSEKARERELVTFEKNLKKTREGNGKKLMHLKNETFACRKDAEKAGERFSKKLKYQNLSYTVVKKDRYGKKGRPTVGQAIIRTDWYIQGELVDDENEIEKVKVGKGMFVIATNECDMRALDNEQVLSVYKDQGVSVERGFRFLKDPYFYAESMYLKKPERIMALIMVMTLSLLMYSLAERRIRSALVEHKEHIWDQKNRETERPTIRWICMIFEDVLLLY